MKPLEYLLFMALLITLLTLLSCNAMALDKTTEDDVTLSWTPPTEYTDGSELPPSDLKNYTVFWTCDASGSGQITVDHPMISVNLKGNLIGNCSLTVKCTTINNSTSDHSESVSVLVKLPKPSYGGFR